MLISIVVISRTKIIRIVVVWRVGVFVLIQVAILNAEVVHIHKAIALVLHVIIVAMGTNLNIVTGTELELNIHVIIKIECLIVSERGVAVPVYELRLKLWVELCGESRIEALLHVAPTVVLFVSKNTARGVVAVILAITGICIVIELERLADVEGVVEPYTLAMRHTVAHRA